MAGHAAQHRQVSRVTDARWSARDALRHRHSPGAAIRVGEKRAAPHGDGPFCVDRAGWPDQSVGRAATASRGAAAGRVLELMLLHPVDRSHKSADFRAATGRGRWVAVGRLIVALCLSTVLRLGRILACRGGLCERGHGARGKASGHARGSKQFLHELEAPLSGSLGRWPG